MKFVEPKTYLVGYTTIDEQGITQYLIDSGQEEFLELMSEALNEGLSSGEILCSFYAKLCYASLVLGKNKNISKTRNIYDNILSTINSGHGSVFEHCNLNFVTTNCSRVFTHELVRHRVGTAFSQTSGRYVRTDEIGFVYDPILDPVKDDIKEWMEYSERMYKKIEDKLGIADIKDFAHKKRLTSAMRRGLPNGQSNEMGFSLNLRTLRHTLTMRTSEHAEYEIRVVFNQIFDLIKDRYPAIVSDAIKELKLGTWEIKFVNNKI